MRRPSLNAAVAGFSEHCCVTPRANWKGYLRLEAATCEVALFTAASTAERIALNTVNRASGHRVRREFFDSVTDEPVEKDDQVKGYETEKDQYVLFEADEIAEAGAKSDKILSIKAFVALADFDEACLDKPYYLVPAANRDIEFFSILREGLRRRHAGAVAEAVLFRRLRTLLIRPLESGMIATTLHFDYELRGVAEVFGDIPDLPIPDEMLDLAKHIIKTKQAPFDPAQYVDRYESALADLVRDKLEGRAIAAPAKRKPPASMDLMRALRDSAGLSIKSRRRGKSATASPKPSPKPSPKRKQGDRRVRVNRSKAG
jgi:DNA end-binding protein Ku